MGKIEKRTYLTKSGAEVLIRNAEPSDAEPLIKINMTVIDETLYMLRQPGEATYTKEGEVNKIKNFLNDEGKLYIVAQAGKDVVGYLDFQNGPWRRTAHSGSFSLFLLKQWRDSGIGKLLMDNLIMWAEKSHLIEKLTLAVFSNNERAQNLYRKCGFMEEGRCPEDMKFENGTYMDSVLMYRFVK